MPLPLEVRFRALTSKRKLINDEKIVKEILKYLDYIAEDILEDMKYYPPYQSPTYIRTGDLGRGWIRKITATTRGLYLYITNDVEYAEYVQGENQQPIFTAIGWNRLVDVVERIRKNYRRDLQDIIRRNIG